MYEKIAVYIVAHQDDWQLFMDPFISSDLLDPSCRTVIIHTTAGDAGEGKPFWQAREAGAISSLRFRLSGNSMINPKKRTVTIHDKRLVRTILNNTSVYFLRWPDGGMHGDGFATYQGQSMEKIRSNSIRELTSVDFQHTFYSFTEMSALINAIIQEEMTQSCITDAGMLTLNFPEYDETIRSYDHNDHLNTALLVQQTALYAKACKRVFVHYDIMHRSPDLEGNELFWKVGMFSVYHQAVLERHGHSTISETEEYSCWCRKSAICRVIT